MSLSPKRCQCGAPVKWAIETRCANGTHLEGQVCNACLAQIMRDSRPLTNPEVKFWMQQRITTEATRAHG